MKFSLLLRSAAWIPFVLPLAFAQQHQPPNRDRFRSNHKYTAGLIIGISVGTILLLFLASVLYARIVSRRRGESRERAERVIADEEFTFTPLTIPSPALVAAPPPYENPPSFEDTIKREEMAGIDPPREGQDRRGGVAC